MKKYSSYLIPAIITLLVLILIFRWYRGRVREQQLSEFGEGVKIEDLTEKERNDVIKGVGDYKTVELEQPKPTKKSAEETNETNVSPANGVIRYQIEDERVKFSVISTLPELSEGKYQVWIRTLDDSTLQRAFTLEMGKGGYVGSAAVSSELLPFEVIVSKELTDDATLEKVIMRGIISDRLKREAN